MSLKNILTLFKISFLLLIGIVGLVLILSEVQETENIGLLFILSKAVGFFFLYLCYKHFPIKLYLEEHSLIVVLIAINSIVLGFVLYCIILFLHNYYLITFNS